MSGKPYSFRKLPEDCRAARDGYPYGVGCDKRYGDMSGYGGPVASWEEAVERWRRHVARWESHEDSYAKKRPVTPATVDFIDETGEHQVQELFGMVRLL